MYTARWISLNVLRNSPVQLSAMFRVTSGLMTVYCSCPGVLPLKASLLYALHFLTLKEKESILATHCIYVFQIILRESSDYFA